jgi:hypothetical protein
MSLLSSNKSIDEVLEDMFMHVIDNEVRKKPYFAMLSKMQINWGGGVHYKNAPNYIQKGLMKNIGLRIPKKIEIEKAESHYGYKAMIEPWGELNNMTNNIMRNKILKGTLNGLGDIRIMLGKGYITKEGILDPNRTQGISVYIIFLADMAYRDEQNEWIRNQPEWIRFQIARNKATHYDILVEKTKSASTLIKMNRQLIKQQEYKQLDPAVDREQIPWEFNE